MKRLITMLMAVAMLLSLFPCALAAEDTVTCVEFGIYPRTEVEATNELKQAEYDENGDTVLNGTRYRKLVDEDGISRYFRWEPIVWQVVGDVLLARDVIDCKMFDEQEYRETGFMGGVAYCTPVPWEECSLNEFLQTDFKAWAFTEQEQALLAGDVTLFTVEQAKALQDAQTDYTYLPKRATDYAQAAGTDTRASRFNAGDTEWLLRDISPLLSSAVCTIGSGGGINTGMTVLLNEEGMGLVPCISLTDWQSLNHWTEPAPVEPVTIYYPGGRIDKVSPERVDELLRQGWYLTKEEAQEVSLASMEARFAASEFASGCQWSANSWSYGIDIRPNQLNMSPTEAVDYVNRMVETFFTGNMDDYIYLDIKLCYDDSWGETLDEFRESIGMEVYNTLAACFSSWGAMLTIDHYGASGVSRVGWDFELRIQLKLNSNGSYSANMTHYYEVMSSLAEEARAYSDRPLGQLQYLRHYFGQNTVYDANLFNNNPITLTSSGVGICGTYATFVNDFCKVMDIPCMILSCDKLNPSHAWNAVYLEGGWYQIDTTGFKDEAYMRSHYSDYSVDGTTYSFDPAGFPDEHTAENVDFLFDHQAMLSHEFGSEECCNVSSETFRFLQQLLRSRPSSCFTDVHWNSWFVDYVDYMVENGCIQGVAPDRFGPGTLATRGMVVTILHRQAGSPEAQPADFTDVLPGQWYADAVAWVAERGVVKGYSDGRFGPNDPITREQLATILWRNSGCPESEQSLAAFADESAISDYARSAIRWCVETGILSGYTDGTLRPGNTATRAELAKMLTVYFESAA